MIAECRFGHCEFSEWDSSPDNSIQSPGISLVECLVAAGERLSLREVPRCLYVERYVTTQAQMRARSCDGDAKNADLHNDTTTRGREFST